MFWGFFFFFYAGKKGPLKCLPCEMWGILSDVCRSSVANSDHLDQVKKHITGEIGSSKQLDFETLFT